MGRAWDIDPRLDTVDDCWVDGTGLGHRARHATQFTDISGPGWVDGSGLGQQHRHTTQTHTGSGLMVGWLGWAWKTHTLYIYSSNTAQRDNTSGPTVGWMGWAWVIDDTLTRQHNTDSNGSGLMVGWLGWAWKTHIFICSRLTQQRDNISGPMVGWMGWARDNSTHTRQYNTDSNGSGLMVGRDNISGHGRVVGSGLGHRRTLNSTTLTHTWVWPHGWVDGMGLEDHMNGTAIFDTLNDYRHIWPTHTFLLLDFLDKDSNESGLMGLSASATSQALVGW
ncbi:hypothetical protein AbraCBS73388_002432 [Aspergillus brasiliensis]|uniref:Uncharacterized protein n=1 Tax=Aspergillus brasiliensis TaxID=319629 RepID=A0A9W5Z0T0_9EURO|nr:hypothetical protein AbraCBS73388_002432 [Aspergillus brasiliensis]